jgi:fructose-1,6-bisphosphatase/inositol monophosphatase family enzyme
VQKYLDTALELAATAGEIMLHYFDVGVPADWKADDSPVTVADTEINQMVIDRIAARYPDHGVVGEEASLSKPDSPLQWVCDPIDGTVPFMLGIPTNVFSLALCEDGDPLVAVIADPYLSRTYLATRGGGSFCNERRLSVSETKELPGSLMNVSGRDHDDPADGAFIYRALDEAGVKQIYHHSMVYEEIQVASGMFDAAIFAKSNPWDSAAGALLVTEAGGIVTNLLGAPQRYDRRILGTIFSNGHLHDALVTLATPSVRGR